MRKLYTWILFIGIIFCSSTQKSYSQEIGIIDTYVTADSLAYIYILPDNKFGYISYHGTSPFSYRHNKNLTRGRIDGPSFIMNQQGAGTYKVKKKNISLNFIQNEHNVEKIVFNKVETQKKANNFSIKITIKSFAYEDEFYDNIGIGSYIKSKDGKIDLNSEFENYFSFKVNKNQLPLELTLNGIYSFVINKKCNQEILIYFNDFKRSTADKIENKVFNMNDLIKIEQE